jgi:hypothetical protein
LPIKKKEVITFSPMNNQKMCNAPVNYQLDQNRTFNYQRQPFSPIPLVREVKRNSQRSCAVLYGGMLEDSGSSWGRKRKMVVVHGGKRGRK